LQRENYLSVQRITDEHRFTQRDPNDIRVKFVAIYAKSFFPDSLTRVAGPHIVLFREPKAGTDIEFDRWLIWVIR